MGIAVTPEQRSTVQEDVTIDAAGHRTREPGATAVGSGLPLRRTWLSILTSVATLAVAPAIADAEGGGAAVAWGGNTHAELGAGFRDTYEESPVSVAGLNNITAVALGSEFTLALLSDGTVRAWGNNGHGQLGDGTGGQDSGTWSKGANYVSVSDLGGVKAIAAANSHALALLENGTVKAWGNNNYGQLGDGKGGIEKASGESDDIPKTVEGLTNVMAIASGGGSNFALLSNGTLMAWGENAHGQLGIGETGPETCVNEVNEEIACSTKPREVVTAPGTVLKQVVAVSAGEQATYALLRNGHVMSWGANTMGQLGTGGEPLRVNLTPEEVKSPRSGGALGGVAALSGGAFDALAVLETGQVLGWGAVGKGELGDVAQPEECKKIRCVRTAQPIKGLENRKVTSVSAGEGYSLAVSGEQVYSFGANGHGELGDGSTSSNVVPTAIGGLGPVSAVAAGNANGNGKAHALALLQSGVAPPPPVVSLQPGIRSLKLLWTLHAEEYELEYNHRNRGKCEEVAASEETEVSEETDTCEEVNEYRGLLGRFLLGKQVHSFEFTRLESQPYVISIRSRGNHHLEKKRAIIGTPLP